MTWTYYGGPADGGPVEKQYWKQDFITLELANTNNITVVYVYMKCPGEHKWFEFAGELKEDDSV